MEHLDRFLGRLKDVVKRGRGWKATCPVHDDPNRSLSVSLGEGGRILFYCHAGCNREQILQNMNLTWKDLHARGPVHSTPVPISRPRRVTDDLDLRHAVYSDLLKHLVLTREHWDQLDERGLWTPEVERNEYRSLQNPEQPLSDELFLAYGRTATLVPGVHLAEGGQLVFRGPPGLVIPVRNSEGLIRAVQIRTGEADRKYYWPAGSGSPVHVPLGVSVAGDTLWVTEGPLKADVVAFLTGLSVTSVTSVTGWRIMLAALKQWSSIRLVVTAFDMDWETKPQVREQLEQFEIALLSKEYRVQRLMWSREQGKGLDDYLVNGGTRHQLWAWEIKHGGAKAQGEGQPAGA